jgi:hypothetical protein
LKLLAAAKLLKLQKDVGFTFEEPTGAILEQLIEQEMCDQAKKIDWEDKEGYQ